MRNAFLWYFRLFLSFFLSSFSCFLLFALTGFIRYFLLHTLSISFLVYCIYCIMTGLLNSLCCISDLPTVLFSAFCSWWISADWVWIVADCCVKVFSNSVSLSMINDGSFNRSRSGLSLENTYCIKQNNSKLRNMSICRCTDQICQMWTIVYDYSYH